MEQRRLRPGDRLDDYCPRERRVSDHVVVAVVDDTIKQTRCVTCDTEHPFKGGRPPLRRKPKEAPSLVTPKSEPVQVEPETVDSEPLPSLIVKPERKPGKSKRTVPPAAVASFATSAAPPDPLVPPPPVSPPSFEAQDDSLRVDASEESGDEGPVHRRLIRATLPRPEGQVPVRPIPEFTIRQPGSRNGFGRNGGAHRGSQAKGGNRSGSWNGMSTGAGHRSGAPAHEPGGGRGRQWHGRPKSGNTPHKKAR
ncbi:MAG: hypothetical protein AB7I50_12710 [Vicinamibacterales bacterium]